MSHVAVDYPYARDRSRWRRQLDGDYPAIQDAGQLLRRRESARAQRADRQGNLRGQNELHPAVKAAARPATAGCCVPAARVQSSGSTLTIEAPWLLPVQNVTGLVVLSTNTRRILVVFGSR